MPCNQLFEQALFSMAGKWHAMFKYLYRHKFSSFLWPGQVHRMKVLVAECFRKKCGPQQRILFIKSYDIASIKYYFILYSIYINHQLGRGQSDALILFRVVL